MSVAEELMPVSEQVQHCQRLAHVLVLTKKMLAHADNEEWEAVVTIEQERREDLMACFSVPPSVDSELIAEAIATLLHLNEELMSKLKVARNVVMQQGIAFSRGRSAMGNYQAVEATS